MLQLLVLSSSYTIFQKVNTENTTEPYIHELDSIYTLLARARRRRNHRKRRERLYRFTQHTSQPHHTIIMTWMHTWKPARAVHTTHYTTHSPTRRMARNIGRTHNARMSLDWINKWLGRLRVQTLVNIYICISIYIRFVSLRHRPLRMVCRVFVVSS